jgi:hypothetical protein
VFIADVAADIDKDQRVTMRKLVLAHGVSKNTILNTLHKDLNLSKKNPQDGTAHGRDEDVESADE